MEKKQLTVVETDKYAGVPTSALKYYNDRATFNKYTNLRLGENTIHLIPKLG